MSWTLLTTAEPGQRTFTRPLNASEQGYYWDHQFTGTADLIWHYVVEGREDLFQQDNVIRAWTRTKQEHPLLASSLDGSDPDNLRYTVSEKRMTELIDGEVTFLSAASHQDVHALVDDVFHGDQRSLEELPVRVFFLRRTDQPSLYHILFNTTHVIADGVSHTVLCRTFFQILSSPVGRFLAVTSVEKRLAMVVAYDTLFPSRPLNSARQRWRQAMASVVFNIRRQRVSGGHTIPRSVNASTSRTPARKRDLRTSLSSSSTARILENCRQHGITFGSVLPVVTQLATMRVLQMQHFRGQISDEEWKQRKREPAHFFMPVNLRPYLDQDWRGRGGSSEILLSVNIFQCTLPIVPPSSFDNGPSDKQSGIVPLLSQTRFIERCSNIKKQMESYMKHPLFPEILEAGIAGSLAKRKRLARLYAQAEEVALEETTVRNAEFTYMLGISSGGNYDLLQPTCYPFTMPESVPPRFAAPGTRVPADEQGASNAVTTTEVALRIVSWETHLHVRPAYFYLGALTTGDRLELLISWDGNTFDGSVVAEWFKEVESTLLEYLA